MENKATKNGSYESSNALTIISKVLSGREVTASQKGIVAAHVFTAGERINVIASLAAAGVQVTNEQFEAAR